MLEFAVYVVLGLVVLYALVRFGLYLLLRQERYKG